MLPNERTTRSEVVTLPGDMEGLVVAPSRDEARTLVSFLRSQRLNVQLVTDAEIAFEEALIHPPDVILVDDSIGPAGGIELCQRLKGNNRTHFVPVVLWAPSDQAQYRLRAWAAGADAVFSPAVDVQERRTRLWALLRTHAIYRRQERKQRSQGSAIQTRRRWVDAFIHDLQNSVLALQANFEYLSRSVTSAAKAPADDVGECVRDTRGIFSDMVRGLRTVLDYERLEAGRMIVRETPVLLAGLVKDVVDDLAPHAEASRKAMLVRMDQGLVVTADRELLRGALYNLLAHALRQPLNATVEVSVITEDDGITVSVQGDRDELDGGDVERIFEPYARPQRHAPVGHGLGLALAKAVVELHGGRIWVERNPGGHGWGFRLHLPGEKGQGHGHAGPG